MAELFWLTETQMARLRPLLPNEPRGMPRVDDRKVISGIVHVLISGGHTNKLHALVDGQGRPKAPNVTPGQRGRAPVTIGLLTQLPPLRILAAYAAYDSRALRQFLLGRGTTPVIPNNPIRKHHQPFNRSLYRRRNVVERSFDTADMASLIWDVGAAGYSASKAALNMLTVKLAKALLADKVKVNAADPGYTATDLNGHSGTRTVEEAATIAVALATLGPLGPTGGLFNDGHAGELARYRW